jgi:hypothetical protein
LTYEERQHVIICNSQKIRVGENLYEFLRQLRRDQEPYTQYWIDAICINQQDVEEKSQQILLMPKVYTSASRVLAWLGPCPKILDDPRIMSGAMKDSWTEFSDNSWQTILPSLACWYLLWRLYFTRVWIVQEMLLAKQLDFLIGPYQLSQDEIQEVFEPLTRSVPPTFPRFISEKIMSVTSLLASRSRYHKREGWTLVDFFFATIHREATDPRDFVYANLGTIQGPTVKATRPGARAIVKFPDRHNLSLLDRPDYTANIREVYIHCAIRMLQEEGLGALSLACNGTPDPEGWWSMMPSWVPHFNSSSPDSILFADKNQSYAAGGFYPPEITVTASELLLLETGAVLLDSVDVIFGSGLNAIDDLLLRVLNGCENEYPSTGERNLVALARTLMADCFQGERLGARAATLGLKQFLKNRLEYATRQVEWHNRMTQLVLSVMPWDFATVPQADWYWKDVVQKRSRLLGIVEKFLESQEPGFPDERDQQMPHADVHHHSRADNTPAPTKQRDGQEMMTSSIPQTGSFLDTITRASSNRELQAVKQYLNPEPDSYDIELGDKVQHHAFFTTKGGRFGIGSPHLKKGDIVLVLAGAAIPYVGRRLDSVKPTPRFKLMGETYVHGIMDGEVFDSDLWDPEIITFR